MTAVQNRVPIPLQDPIARPKRPQFKGGTDPLEGRLTDPWLTWFDQLTLLLEQAPSRVNSVSLTDQSASIGATDMTDGIRSAGLYELKYIARITQAATTSSSLTVVLDWKDDGVTLTFTGAAITGNTLSAYQSGPTFAGLIRIEANSPVRYSTTYGSVGATPMKYKIDVVLTEVNA